MFLVVAVLAAVVAAGGPAASAMARAAAQPSGAPATLPVSDLSAVEELAGLSLSPAQVTVQELAEFTLDVLVNCGTNADAAGIEVTFDPAYMQVILVTRDDSAFPNVLRNRFDNAAGIVYYDAGAALECHSQGSCPAGVVRLAAITLRATSRTLPTKLVSIRGQIVWAGNLIFDGQGSGSTITITSTSPLNLVYLPSVVRRAPSGTSSTPADHRQYDPARE